MPTTIDLNATAPPIATAPPLATFYTGTTTGAVTTLASDAAKSPTGDAGLA